MILKRVMLMKHMDKITTEMMKYMGEDRKRSLGKFINWVWKTGKVPYEWEIGNIVPIYKSEDKKDCKNYREITILMGIVMMVYEKLIEMKIGKQVKGTMTKVHSGFRPGRSAQTYVFSIKTIINQL